MRFKHKIGDVIYPNSEEGLILRKQSIIKMSKNCWAVVTKIRKNEEWKNLRYWYSNEAAELHSMIIRGSKRFFDENKKRGTK